MYARSGNAVIRDIKNLEENGERLVLEGVAGNEFVSKEGYL